MKTIINACTTKSTTMNNSNSKRKSNNNKSQLEQSKNSNQEAPYIAERILQTMVDWYKKGLFRGRSVQPQLPIPV